MGTGVVFYRPGRAEALPMLKWALPIPLWVLAISAVISRILALRRCPKFNFFLPQNRNVEILTPDRISETRTKSQIWYG